MVDTPPPTLTLAANSKFPNISVNLQWRPQLMPCITEQRLGEGRYANSSRACTAQMQNREDLCALFRIARQRVG